MVGMAEPSYRPDRFDVVPGRGAMRDEIGRCLGESQRRRGRIANGLVVATTCFADPDNDALLHWTVNVQYGPP